VIMATFETKTPPWRFDYDLEAPGFMDFFEARTGYQTRRCECGFDYVRDVCANPAVPPPDSSWRETRALMQAVWERWRAGWTGGPFPVPAAPPAPRESLPVDSRAYGLPVCQEGPGGQLSFF
jgi:hypothetical protein